jgi:hypothetical protein
MMSEQRKYLDLCNASPPTSRHPQGIVVASDISQEWLLPWWWDNYIQFNAFPVTFVDMGLSLEMKLWCKERGELIVLPISGLFVTERQDLSIKFISALEKQHGTHCWESRQSWFRKPLACLQSPYESTLWIDLDCEIKGSLKELFSLCRHPSGLSILKEDPWPNGEQAFNSGVIAFQKGTKIIRDWALESFEGHLEYFGDQDVLTAVIKKQNIVVGDLPPIYNLSRFLHPHPDAIVIHWHGHYGKRVISHQILKNNLPI